MMGRRGCGGGLLQLLSVCAMVAVHLVHGEVSSQPKAMDTSSLSHAQAQRDHIEKANSSGSVSALTTRTERIDPLDSLKKYRGGFNITNKHYWSSTIFTGKYGYAIAVLCLLGGLVYAIILIIAASCYDTAKKKSRGPLCLKRGHFWPITVGILLTLLAIVASGVALSGSIRVHSRAKSIKDIITAATQEATGTLYNVTEALTAMQQGAEFDHYSEVSYQLDSMSHMLNDEASDIQSKAEKIMGIVDKGLNVVEAVNIGTLVLNITLILALMVSAPLRLPRTFRLLIFISWLLTVLFWMYFGLYFFLDKFAGDSCVAFDEYRMDPQGSSLSSILPCNDQHRARSILRLAGVAIHDIVNQVNDFISRQSSSLPRLLYICNPISGPPKYKYQPLNCSSNSIHIGDIPKILKPFACSGSGGESCEQGEAIPANIYGRIMLYTSSIQNILDSFHAMDRLVSCQLVKDAFSEILFRQCTPTKKFVRMTWAGFLALSITMVMLVVTWILKAHQDTRCYSFDGSVKPQLNPSDISEVEATDPSAKQMEFEHEP